MPSKPNGYGPRRFGEASEETDAGLLENGDPRLPPSAEQAKTDGGPLPEERASLVGRLRPVMILLQIFGYYPSCYKVYKLPSRLWFVSLIGRALLVKWSLAIVSVSMYLFKENVSMTIFYNSIFELLHAQTISSIILGLKPLINAVIVLAFLLNIGRHHKFLNQLDHMDRLFHKEFSADPPVLNLNLFITLTTLFVHMLFTGIRLVEHYFLWTVGMEKVGVDWMVDISFVVVPVMTTAAVLPLLYFEICNRVLRFWSKSLRKSIRRDVGNRPIRFYYEMFLQLARTQDLMGKAFNPFILFSLGWAVFSLCLTIYFVTQSDSHFTPPPAHLAPPPYQWLLIIVFNQAYGGLQVLLALVYISVLCFTGTATNEKTRYIVRDLLNSLPEHHDASGRFYVTCFIYKISSQYMWGVTVWRAFPLERSTFFTIVSMILTYAFLLLKFKKDNPLLEAAVDELSGNGTLPVNATGL